MIDFNELAVFRLGGGSHESAEAGVCAMEAVAWLEGLPHSDRPECTCPVIAAYVRNLNDSMDPVARQTLIAYLPRLVGTVSKEHERERGKYLAWQAIRVFAPARLKQAGLGEHARALTEARTLGEAADAAYAAADAAYDADADTYDADADTYDADADAVTYAAYAAYAATAPAAAANNAAAAGRPRGKDWAPALAALDGVLEIGPKSEGFTADTAGRVEAYRELVPA